MDRKRVLVVGGYGTVGRVVSEILAKDEHIQVIIAGRNEVKARELATALNSEWRTIDISDTNSINIALTNIDIIINCFSGPFTNFPLLLPESAARRGIHYMDVSGSYENAERFLALHELAVKNNATLITALGTNPGIPGIALMSAKIDFDELESARIVFVLGAGLNGISVSSLKELKNMFAVKPLLWSKPQWLTPKVQSYKEYVGLPFAKEIYMGLSLTRDLLVIPELTGINELSFWSGSQNTWQGLAMISGLKSGVANSERGALLLLNLLKKMGKSKGSVSDALIKIIITGKKNRERLKQTVQFYCEENYATALAPAIVCHQFVEEKIAGHGAFVPPQIVPAVDFMEKLEKYPIHYSVTTELY